MPATAAENEEIARTLYPGRFRHTPLAGAEGISTRQVADYWRDGFLAINGFFTPSEVADAQQSVSDLIAGKYPEYTGYEFEGGKTAAEFAPEHREAGLRKLWTFVDHSAQLNAMAHHPRLLHVLEQLLDAPVKLIQDMALLKPPFIGGEKPWHQDNAYFVLEPIDRVLGVWIALDAATCENGCMHVIPATHEQGPKPHFHGRDCQLPDESVEVARDTAVPLEPGGMLIFSSLLHHGTPPNKSPQRRRALQFHYASIHCTRMSDARHQELFRDPAHPERYTACASHFTGMSGTKMTER